MTRRAGATGAKRTETSTTWKAPSRLHSVPHAPHEFSWVRGCCGLWGALQRAEMGELGWGPRGPAASTGPGVQAPAEQEALPCE